MILPRDGSDLLGGQVAARVAARRQHSGTRGRGPGEGAPRLAGGHGMPAMRAVYEHSNHGLTIRTAMGKI